MSLMLGRVQGVSVDQGAKMVVALYMLGRTFNDLADFVPMIPNFAVNTLFHKVFACLSRAQNNAPPVFITRRKDEIILDI